MNFSPTRLEGLYLIDVERHEDQRGFFARTFSAEEFERRGLSANIAQCSLSRNTRRGTLRGLHRQEPPYEEAKLVRCGRGAIYDVALDLRPGSPTFKQWEAAELTAANGRMFYIPEGFAHGFLTLEDDSEVVYQMSTPYRPEASLAGFRWNDPAFSIRWPQMDSLIISEKDRNFPDFAWVTA